MQNLYFKVAPAATQMPTRFNPVPRKIIDVSVYQGNELQFSSVAMNYLYQEKHGLLVEARKKEKQSFLRLERRILQFPIPRLPSAFVHQIPIESIRRLYEEYLGRIPSSFKAQVQETNENFSFYEKLDSPMVPTVQTVFPNFIEWYSRLCAEYVAVFQPRKKEVQKVSGPREQAKISLEDMEQEVKDETYAALNFFRFSLQIPYVPPFSIMAKDVFKCFNYDTNQPLRHFLQKVLRVKPLQEMFSASLSRRWEPDDVAKQIIEKTYEPEPGTLAFQSQIDYTIYHVFQFIRLMQNCQLLPAGFFGLVINLMFGSQCYSYEEVRPLLVRMDKYGILQWLLKCHTDVFDAVYKEGGVNKLLTTLEFYAEGVRRQQAKPVQEEAMPQTLDAALEPGSREWLEELSLVIAFFRRVIEVPSTRERGFYGPSAKKVSKLLADLSPKADAGLEEQFQDLRRRINQLIKK